MKKYISVLILILILIVVGLFLHKKSKKRIIGNYEILFTIERFEKFEFIREIKFKNLISNQVYKFVSPDGNKGSAGMGTLFYKDVISPDKNWLVLPTGKFSGFLVLHKDEINNFLKNKKGGYKFWVSSGSGPKFYYKFIKWEGDEKIRILYGMSGSDTELIVNIKNKKVLNNKVKHLNTHFKKLM